MRRLFRIGVVAGVLLATLGGAAGSHAYTIYSQTGVVTRVFDGDTFEVDLDGGGIVRIRMTGINAMETGQCHDPEAESRLSQLILGKTVTLKARSLKSMSGTRYWRWVSVGSVDINKKLLDEGLVVPFPHPYENAKNVAYLKAGTIAASKRIGIWDSDDCRSGPDQDNKLKLWVQWDADGTDSENVNGDYVRIKNYGDDSVSLAGWWLRDSVDHYYYFKSWQSIPAHGRVVIHMGKGTNTSTRYYAGFGTSPFGNVPANNSYGDGAFLLDPHGDIRAFMTYPCVYACSAPLRGKIRLRARYDGDGSPDDPNDEWVKITNISDSTIDLAGYLLESFPYIYDFDRRASVGSRLRPGESMRVYSGKGKETRRARHWGKSKAILTNTGDVVKIRTFDNVLVKCKAWGYRSC